MKIKKLLGFTIILLIVFSFIGCPDPETEYVYVDREVQVPDTTLVFRAESKPVTFGNKGSVRIEGTLTAAEWNGVPEKVRAALESAYLVGNQTRFGAVFNREGVTIIVTKGIDGTYRANNGSTLYLNLSSLSSAELPGKIATAVNAMFLDTSYPAVGQVKKQNRVRFGGGMSAFELV